MNWFSLIKVEDIDFDSAINGFGHYAMGARGLTFEETLNVLGAKMGLQKPENKKLSDFTHERIRINHHEVYTYLKEKLGKEPTEKQLAMYITRVIMHEGTHAGMGTEQSNLTTAQSEYGAFVGQFPESMYMRMRAFLKHPAAKNYMLPPEVYAAYGFPIGSPRFVEVIEDTVKVADGLANNSKDKEKIVELEALARKKNKPDLSQSDFMQLEVLVDRWGKENQGFIESLLGTRKSSPNSNNDDTEKATGAVTTSSAPSMFNTSYSGKKKKDDEEYA